MYKVRIEFDSYINIPSKNIQILNGSHFIVSLTVSEKKLSGSNWFGNGNLAVFSVPLDGIHFSLIFVFVQKSKDGNIIGLSNKS